MRGTTGIAVSAGDSRVCESSGLITPRPSKALVMIVVPLEGDAGVVFMG